MTAPAVFQFLPGDLNPAHIARGAQGAPILKTCQPQNTAAIHMLGCRHWLRYYAAGDDGLGVDPDAWAHQLADECRAAGAWPDVVTPRNEIAPDGYVGVWYARWRMAMEREGCPRSTVLLLPSFPQGRPEGYELRAIFQACAATDTRGRLPMGCDFHEYADLSVAGSSPYHTLRCKAILNGGWIPRGTPVYIGECLIDAVTRGGSGPDANAPLEDPQGRNGWDDRGKMTADQAAAQLNLYLAQLPPEVVCAAWFADGETPGGRWWDYRSWNTPIEDAIRQSWQGASPVAPIVGIDVSTFQVDPQDPQPVDWAAVAASGRAFAYCKATEGTGYVDPQLAHNWPGIRAAGLARGCYHYARFDLGNRPEDEAAYFLAHVGTWQPGDYFVLDAEQQTSLGDLSGWVVGWLDAVAARTGAKKVVYSYASFLAAHNLTQAALGADVSLILAAYQAIRPAVPAGWDRYVVWQHTDRASVPGVQLATDEDYLEIPLDELRALGVPGGDPVDQQAQQYYFQDGFKVPTGNALWTVALEPLYAYAMQLKAQGSPLADLVMPGPLKSGELPATWGQGRPASVAKLTNREVGVYQDAGGVWRPYQAEIF